MKQNPYDLVTERAFNIVEKISDRIVNKHLKGINPYDKTPISKQKMAEIEQNIAMGNISEEDKAYLMNNYGPDAVRMRIMQGGMYG